MLPYISNQDGLELSAEGLWDSLQLPLSPHMIISLVGGGGKTSLMYQLAQELSALGKRVIITTSTHIGQTDKYPILIVEEYTDFSAVSWSFPIVVASPSKQAQKLKGLSIDQITRMRLYADVVLVEADGSKRLPLKMPADHEPVIVPKSAVVIACAGLDSIGKSIKQTCFRAEEVGRFLNKDVNELITPQDIVKILTSDVGGKKQVGAIPYRIIINKADTVQQRKQGLAMMQKIYKTQKQLCLMTSFGSQEK